MKRKTAVFCVMVFLVCSGFTEQNYNGENFTANEEEFFTEQVEVCSSNSTKTYMNYKLITDRSSSQYQYIQNNMTVDQNTGLLYDEDGFIGAALGSKFGEIGSRYYFTLDTGVVLPIVKIEQKSDQDTVNGCYHSRDGSVIELVVDTDIAKEYFNSKENNVIKTGNFNDDENFAGKILTIEKLTEMLPSKEEDKKSVLS